MNISDIDERVYDVCRAWYDGETLPQMRAVAFRNSSVSTDVDLGALLAELRLCADENSIARETPKIERAISWVEHEIRRSSVEKELEKAIRGARDAGIDFRDVQAILTSVWSAK